ncbi:hypothetical protein UC35_02545 [Ramlibacter tataouinensis]|uniref:Uncharacterized protein n=2 Tax=Ramlibacter tataouinensis TaxID=94132 RepID=A0A127JPY1_9BURK|nr:hypothetical protein UC35_02545 [Ramlibacter tataouinensis]
MEAAAVEIESLEAAAERRFDQVFANAEAAGEPEAALKSEEFTRWLAARRDTDAAWGRWSLVMSPGRPA